MIKLLMNPKTNILIAIQILTLSIIAACELLSTSNEISVIARLDSNSSLQFTVLNNSANKVSVMGPMDSALRSKPQTYWLEAVDGKGTVILAKLPTSFGLHHLELKLTKPEPSLQKRETKQNESKEEKLKRFHEEGTYSGDPYGEYRDGLSVFLDPGCSWSHIIPLVQWFDFETNKTYSVKVKLQPTKDSPVFESNPVIIKLSDKLQKKQLVPAEGIKKSN